MTDYLRRQMFNIIAAVFLILFVLVWLAVLLRVGTWVPVAGLTAPALNGALVTAAGVMATSLGSLTASALGFTIAEVKREQSEAPPGSPGASFRQRSPPGFPAGSSPQSWSTWPWACWS